LQCSRHLLIRRLHFAQHLLCALLRFGSITLRRLARRAHRGQVALTTFGVGHGGFGSSSIFRCHLLESGHLGRKG